MFRNRKTLMILSLLIAIALWMFVMDQVDPKTELTVTDVKVEMHGTDVVENMGLTATLVKPKIVNVELQGKRSQVNKAKKKGLKAYIDVSTCDYGENEAEIRIELPSGVRGVTVEHISQYTAKFNVK
ncbi:MAG: hypothetical protein IJL99_00090 [Firmicutes bacterium]|nr:hypothetical protein [Bacillota bacterium]